MVAEAEVNTIIEANLATAETATQRTLSAVTNALSIALGAVYPGSTQEIPVVSVDVPNFVNTGTDLGDDFLKELQNALGDLGPKFDDLANDFIKRFFPNFAKCLTTVTDAWICDVIKNGTTGIPPNVERLIWQRARDRVNVEGNTRLDTVLIEWSARGFSLPSGIVLTQQENIRQDVADKVYEVNRDAAIKAVDVQIETIKFAVSEAIKLRLGVISALVDYIKAWIAMRQLAIETANDYVEAKRKLFQGIEAYYNALIAALGLTQRAQMFNVESHLKQEALDIDVLTKNIQRAVEGTIGAADALARVAANALGSLNTLASIDNTTIQAS